ncbi:helix-turn-helix transcriptional regulator [Streptomyces sp. IB2014 016-6]|uniref:helix-turn-helix domain-containing protein n=1 Tax=Streptomyces sp. IB2014 016-6 TaxID=2517818 RepID=UPI0011CCBC04|nr:helix-turn-helix transcriptional regulator [Streptomyces sp. IB2014 016-6]TXL84603.1 XRE family transcriptional regulator [Streptomyces sp. IB2014 016-6]
MQWSEYTTAERLKALRSGMTQEQLAEAAEVSVGVVRKLERGGTASLPSLLAIASALGTDIAVLLGQQAPRRSMDRDERAALRILSAATHDAAIGIPAAAEPGTVAELRTVVKRADAAYWAGRYAELGTVLAALLPEARARYDAAGNDEKEAAAGVLADVFQTAGMAANVWGSRDLAYAALTYGRQIAVQAGDDLREAHLAATTAWVNLRDGRTAQGFALAAAQANRIEPRMSEHDPDRLSVYGQLVTNAAVAASRGGASADTAREYLSQAHAVGARLGGEYARGGHAQPYGPLYAATQAMSIAVALGDTTGALRLMDTIKLDETVPLATRARYGLDVALTHVECRRWERAADTLEAVCTMAPGWVQHQMLPGVIISRLAGVSVGRLRGLAHAAGVPLGVR